MRSKIIVFMFAAFFLFLAAYLFNAQIINGGKFRDLSNKNCIRLIPKSGSRGKILDRNNAIIAGNLLAYDVMVMPKDSWELEASLDKLSKILNTDPNVLEKRFQEGYGSPGAPVSVARRVPVKKALAVEEEKGGAGGIIVHAYPVRYYPFGSMASHVLGYLSEIDHWRLAELEEYGYKTKDIVGFGGIEEKYDYYLRQEDGGLSVEVDRKGKMVRVIGFKPPQSGKNVQLTIDSRLQQIAEDVLKEKKGAVVLMNPYNGEILALASSPDFSPSVFVEKNQSVIQGLFSSRSSPLMNRAISATYPPGSVFKLVVAAAGLETAKINKSQTFECTGSVIVGQQEFACNGVHGLQNMQDAIAHSCNSYFYRLGLLLGPQIIHDYAVKFGFAVSSGIELPYESAGLIPSPVWKKIHRFRSWFDGDTANFAIGQGDVLVTPLQVARMVAVFANQGKLVQPVIIKAIDGKNVAQYHSNIHETHLKVSTIEDIREGMRAVVQDARGTANMLNSLPVPIAGKTGTAQASGGAPHGWFAGFFPYTNPRFVMCVFLERGGSGAEASRAAKEIIEKMVEQNLI